ncbi:MAG: hypothetical protein IPH29_18665 [Candidatus Microthrix sp.]|nr:hypothetical protein [Candidatus Microthrix sp.]
MAGLIVADASALIAYLNPGDAHHADAVQGLIDVDQFVVHPVTLAEVLVHPARSGSESTWWAPRFRTGVELVILVGVHFLGGYRLVDAASISRVEARLATFWSEALDGAEL